MTSENNEQNNQTPSTPTSDFAPAAPILNSPLSEFNEPTSDADASQSTPSFNSAQPNATQPNVAPRSPFRAPSRPLGFWAVFFKDVTASIAGAATFCFLAFFLFLMSIIALAAALGDAADSGTIVEETISGDETSKGKIVVLPIEGVIETEEYGFLREAIDCIADDERVRGVVLRINSPGGTISGSDYYYTLLKDLKEELNVPVIASMGDVAASGGYYIATAADQIFAERSTLTGSIGVIVSMYDASELCEKVGVASTPVVSGPMKGMGDFMKKPTPEETAVWQALVDESYEQFLEVVRDGRPWYRGADLYDELTSAPPVDVEERFAELRRVADGRVYTAKQAKELRLIDEIGFLDDAIDATIQAAGLTPENAQVVRYEEIEDFASALGLSALAKKPSEPLGKALDTVSTPRAYYILPRALPTTSR